MLKKIIGTAGTKIISALLSFIIISMNARFLGAEAVGTIALIILGITIVLLFSSLGGGAALVYLTPRHEVTSLYIPSFLWSLITSAIVAYLLILLEWVPREYRYDLFFLSVLRALGSNHTTILLGKERIRTNNILALAEIGLLFISVLLFYFILENQSVGAYILALYFAYSAHVLLSLFTVAKYLSMRKTGLADMWVAFKRIVRYSVFIQTASFFQLLNYRLSYYFLEFFSGRAAVGVYSVGTRLSESLWIISKSISTVQLARISNSEDKGYSIALTVRLFRFILFITTLLTLILLLLPVDLYTWLFGQEFHQIKIVLLGMGVGIVSLACSMAFSGYFSGTGKQHLNTSGSLIGVFFTLGGGFLLIPAYGLEGAAITASLSYFSTALFYFISFIRQSKCSLRNFIPGPGDLKIIRDSWKKKA